LREERRLRVVKNRVLRSIFGHKRDEIRREWRKLHNEELNDLNSSTRIIRLIKLKRMRWAGRIARMRRVKVYIRFWWGKLRERDHLKNPGVLGRIILR
jgi:hypothetical protein